MLARAMRCLLVRASAEAPPEHQDCPWLDAAGTTSAASCGRASSAAARVLGRLFGVAPGAPPSRGCCRRRFRAAPTPRWPDQVQALGAGDRSTLAKRRARPPSWPGRTIPGRVGDGRPLRVTAPKKSAVETTHLVQQTLDPRTGQQPRPPGQEWARGCRSSGDRALPDR